MTTPYENPEEAALALEPERRARLALRLIESLDQADDIPAAEIERLWAAEAAERVRQLERGELDAEPAEDVFRDETVDILAVMHHWRGPSHIARRLREGEGEGKS